MSDTADPNVSATIAKASRPVVRRRRSVVEFEKKAELKAALRDCTRRGSELSGSAHRPGHHRRSNSGFLFGAADSDEGSDDEWFKSDGEGSAYEKAKIGAAASGDEFGNQLHESALPSELDWVTENMDADTSLPQTYDDEMERLMVLKSYLLLDSDREASFERITALCSRIFEVPISLVSLVDIGRQWFMSNRGLGDVRETSRKLAFCAHCVQSTNDLLIVPDATEDPRFMDNALVTGPPHIRFYAGAPLVSPEGHRLGTLCVIDAKTRPGGLTMPEQQTLRELSAMVVEEMVRRREEKRRASRDASRVLAETAAEMLVPLQGAREAVKGLVGQGGRGPVRPNGERGDEGKDGGDGGENGNEGGVDRAELGKVAEACLDVMGRICEKAVKSYGEESKGDSDGDGKGSAASRSKPTSEKEADDEDDEDAIVSVTKLADNLRHVVVGPPSSGGPKADAKAKPKDVKISVDVDPAVPAEIVSDDMKLFRSALNYLTSAADRLRDRSKAEEGGRGGENSASSSSSSSVKLRFYVKRKTAKGAAAAGAEEKSAEAEGGKKRGKSYLVCECEDTGDALDPKEVDDLFAGFLPAKAGGGGKGGGGGSFGLAPVADSISSLGGKFGYRPKEGWGTNEPPVGNVFWFTVPLVVPYSTEKDERQEGNKGSSFNSASVGMKQLSDASKANRRGSKILSFTSSDDFDRDAVYDAVSKAMAANTDGRAAAPDVDGLLAKHPAIGAGRRALVIDDSLLVRDIIGKALTSMGFDVRTASDGMEGLMSLQASQYDVVFCDFLMPVYDGPDCIEQYRQWEAKNRPGSHQRIVGLSDKASEEDVKRAAKAGMDGVVTKSSKMSDILSDAMGLIESMDRPKSRAAKPPPRRSAAQRRADADEDRSGAYPAPHSLPRAPRGAFGGGGINGGTPPARPPAPSMSLRHALDGSALSSVETHRAYLAQRSTRRNDAMARLFA